MKGKITISRTSRSDDAMPITIRLNDVLSGIEFVSVDMSLAEFASALTGLGHVECEFTTRGLDRIGCQHEHKTELIPEHKGYEQVKDREKIARAAFAPFEVDGWHGDVSDYFNMHRRSNGVARVIFRRHVRPNGEPVL